MQIRDIEAKTGLDRATIRFYEKEGLIRPLRQENGYRIYSDADFTTLMKVKLLRQLGLSLEQIKDLQAGRGDLEAALDERIRVMNVQIEDLNQERNICREMQNDHVNYESLNAAHYLDLLTGSTPPKTVRKEFSEYLPRPYHPVRRFVARMLDYAWIQLTLKMLLILVLGIRTYQKLITLLLSCGSAFLAVPVLAWMLHRWGTTPGKWCVGLAVESESGDRLTYGAAREREWHVLGSGCGYMLPGYSLVRLFKSYRTYGTREPDWDWESEYIYQDWTAKRKTAGAIFGAVLLFGVLFTAHESILPKYRGDLTIAKFSKNYNHYMKVLENVTESPQLLQSDGTHYPYPAGVTVINIDGEAEKSGEFLYETDGLTLEKIIYENTWTNVGWIPRIPSRCTIAAITCVMSQKGTTVLDMLRFAKCLDEALQSDDGHVVYGQIDVSWHIEAKNLSFFDEGMYIGTNGDDSTELSVRFEICINPP